MTISMIADWADLLAALAIFVSLVFVGFELHQNRTQAGLANWRDLLQTLVDYKGLTHDPELAELVARGHADLAALSDADRMRFTLYLEQGVHIFGNFLKHHAALPRKLHGLDDAVANMFVDMLTTPGGAAWWAKAKAQGRFMPSTYQTVDAILARGRRPVATS